MPDFGELIGRLIGLFGELLSASSLRLGTGATLAVLGVMLVLLQLVARPTTRWTTRDLGGLALEMYKRDRFEGRLLWSKAAEIAAIDDEAKLVRRGLDEGLSLGELESLARRLRKRG